GAPTQPVPQAPGPISSLDPAFGDAPAPPAPGPISSLDPAFGDAPAPQAPGPISSLDPALEAPAPNSAAPDTVPDTVRDPVTERTPDLDPPPSSVQPEAPTVPAGPPSVDPADPI